MNTIKFGFADCIITPLHPTYCYLDGYGFRNKPAEGVRDDLHAKVCAILSGEKTFLLFSLDIIGLRQTTYDLITSQIHDITGISKENVALCCIHTHAAPASGILTELPIDTDYFAYVGECCAKAAQKAIQRATPGSFRFSVLPEQLQSCQNRRKGRDVIDRSIRAAAFHDESGKLRGVLCTAACHAVVNTAYTISADWLACLNAISCDELPYLYFQGRGADINPALHLNLPIDELIDRLGTELAAPVQNFALQSKAEGIWKEEAVWEYETVTLPMRQFDDMTLLDAGIEKDIQEYLSYPVENIQKHFVLRDLQWFRKMKDMASKGQSFDLALPLQYLAIGKQCVFAFVPFELLTLSGNRLEQIFLEAGFPVEGIYICGYSNITEGYLAPHEEFAFGGYEVAGANRWYGISETLPETEKAVLDWFRKKAKTL